MTHDFIAGVITMGFLVAAGFFFRFWRESRDRLFGFFASAFLLMALARPLLVLAGDGGQVNFLPYFMRLAAYAIIILAIVDKNLRRT